MDLRMVLDRSMLERVRTYFIYRSEEVAGDSPIVDGLYVQRRALPDPPPETLRISITWD